MIVFPAKLFYRYEARAQDCQSCPLKPQCCPGNQHRGRGLLRTKETAAMIAFRRKMATPEAQQQYRRQSRVIEFCHAWIKSKLGLRQFHLRGLAKVLCVIGVALGMGGPLASGTAPLKPKDRPRIPVQRRGLLDSAPGERSQEKNRASGKEKTDF